MHQRLAYRLSRVPLRVAAALEGLPETDQALREGRLSWSAARELTRVAAPQTERAWLSAAEGKTVRQVMSFASKSAPIPLPPFGRRWPICAGS